MTWAAQSELPAARKAPHYAVEYENPSRDPKHHCGNCDNFIPAEPNRCRTVIGPINAAAWCKRYVKKEHK